jgi:Protein of unknown function (DUF2628)
MMTVYSLYTLASDPEPRAVPDRFSWFAALLPPFYAMAHGLWLELVGFVAALICLGLLGRWAGPEAAGEIYVLLALLIGFEAGALRRRALRSRGYSYCGERIAQSEDLAELSWLGASSDPK